MNSLRMTRSRAVPAPLCWCRKRVSLQPRSVLSSSAIKTDAWVNVRKGASDGDLIEISGNLQRGDMVVRRATDEIREGTPLKLSPKKAP